MKEESISFPLLDRYPSKSDRVYDILRDKIVKREIQPGDRLVEEELANKFGVSKTPIREALRRLESDGLVDIIPSKGTFVTQLSKDDITEIYELREVLEGLATRKVAMEEDIDEEIDELSSLEQYLKDSFQSDDWDAYNEIDFQFHNLLAEISHNDRLTSILQNIRYQSRLLMTRSIKIPGRAEQSMIEHRKIVEAIKQREPDLAESRAREHVKNVKKALLKNT